MSTQVPRITIVTPSYNQGSFIEQTIQSVLDEGYPDLEYIVLDGGSTDNTVEVLQRYSKYLTYWRSAPDAGQTDAINLGFRRATGEIVNWLNSDDYYEKGALHRVAAEFSDPDVLVVGGRRRVFGDGLASIVFDPPTLMASLEETLLFGSMDQPATFFRRRAIEALTPLSVQLRFTMDTELWLAFLLSFGQERVRRIPDLLVHARLHATAKTVADQDRFFAERLWIYRGIAEALGAGSSLRRAFDQLGVPPPFARLWTSEALPDANRFLALLEEWLLAYVRDPSLHDRQVASYYVHRHIYWAAVRASLGAVRHRPSTLLNYRTLLYCLRCAIANRPETSR